MKLGSKSGTKAAASSLLGAVAAEEGIEPSAVLSGSKPSATGSSGAAAAVAAAAAASTCWESGVVIPSPPPVALCVLLRFVLLVICG